MKTESQPKKVLLTGGFGNVGKAVMAELIQKRHEITVFELDSKKNRKAARSKPSAYLGRVES
ncbi:MAG: hypothetical protein ACTSUE_14805 [Promethearchaeota archaeon]